MKKILGLVISERRLGNSEILTKEIMDNIPEPCNRELIRLTDLNLKPCKACYHCLQPDTSCKMNDDFNFLMEKIKEADALIIAVPVYFLGPHAYYKLLTDRMLSAGHLARHTAGKPCLIVVSYGIKGWEGYTRTAALVLPRLLQMKVVGYWKVHAALPGESVLNEQNIIKTGELGANIFDLPVLQPKPLECPNCGSDLFRFLSGTEAECPLCSSRVKLSVQNGNTVFNLIAEEQAKPCRFSPEGIEEHFLHWLISMKDKFLEVRSQLKEVQKPYLDKKWWIKP
ncbi:MAG: multimeric flavodoxin WrbA-like protein [Peptococcaceae bacterium BRH_c4b]|nr:MAG: multimeric flavodoxin WrbA-like protein [Peptococcaceae bacterium BRH_c4b]